MLALIAHDAKKPDLADWAARHEADLSRHELVATGTTGLIIMQRCPRLKVKRLASGPHGGDQQIGALIVEGQVDALVFFVDPLAPMPHDVDVKALMRLAILYNVLAAFNARSADALIPALAAKTPPQVWEV
jgi:methylglyoxal synthase